MRAEHHNTLDVLTRLIPKGKGMYNRHLSLTEDQHTDLVAWLETELTNHLAEREEFIGKLKRYQSDYLAEPSTEVATFPFAGASTIIIPLTAIALEAVHSRTMQTAFAHDLNISAKIKNPVQSDLEPELERYLQDELITGANFKAAVEPAILEVEKLGTGIIETSYCYHARKGIRINDAGKEEEFDVVIKNGPDFSSVPVANFMMPFDCADAQSARWCGKVFWLTPNQIRQRESDGFFIEGTYEDLEHLFTPGTKDTDNASNYTDHVRDLTHVEPSWPTEIEFYAIATTWEIVEGRYEEVFLLYHRELRKIVGIWYNWYNDLRRPYRKAVYFPVEFRWYGIGIAKQNEQFQYEVTAQHRTRLDNATIANMRMFKVKRTAQVKDDEPIFPGKMWFVDEMDDIESFEMGDVKASAYNNENQVIIFSQQRSGVNELTLGMPNSGTPGTATSEMARVQESARKFDYSYSNIRTLLDESLHDGLLTLAQWGPDVDHLMYNPRGNDIESFLKENPFEYFRKRILVEIRLAGQNQNKFKDRQDATQLVGIFQQYYTNLLTLAQGTQDPNLISQVTSKAFEGANLAMRHIMESFDIRNPERFLITPTQSGQPPIAIPGGGGPAQGASQAPSVQSNLVLAPNASSILPNIPNLPAQLG